MLTFWNFPAQMTVTEFDRLLEQGSFDDGRRVELIRGELRRLSPTAIRHQKTLDELEDWSRHEAPQRVHWRVRRLLGLPELDSVPEPDLVWVDRRPYGGARPGAADVRLLVEVAGASLRLDCTTKADLYAEAEIPEYWVVNLPRRRVEVFRDPSPDGYLSHWTLTEGETLIPLECPDAPLDVSDLFFRFSEED